MTDTPLNDFNQQIIDEFRANDGVVGGPFEGAPMVLVHHTGAKSGIERVTPLVYQPESDDRRYIFASKAGATDNPDWFHNLVANPETTIEVGSETLTVRARVLESEERTRVWEAQKAAAPQFAEYEKTTEGREIPVFALERV
ncbi:nitroreductase/quinone reductase family protein [Actinospongicola halichondriae]|uniref:nitroreductase/quinone reductase family protein n=1 Tax=Actinospongicola halichondriae TaxID=3236844 RepID=UPI003D515633